MLASFASLLTCLPLFNGIQASVYQLFSERYQPNPVLGSFGFGYVGVGVMLIGMK